MAHVRDYFESIVIPYTGDDCLFWPYARQRGHAAIKVPSGKVVRVCTLLCERQYGPKPDGHEVRHSCGKGHLGCVANSHVSWSTHVDNCADRTAHGTEVAGERNGQVKLTKRQVDAIRLSKLTQRAIAAQYGIAQQHVSEIKRRLKWRR